MGLYLNEFPLNDGYSVMTARVDGHKRHARQP